MSILGRFKKIKTFIFDTDGVLTDGSILVLDGGEHARRMNIKDGFALQMAIKNGYSVVVISGGHSNQVRDRLDKLGVSDVHMSVMNKKEFVLTHIKKHNTDPDSILYMGDDLPDLPAMEIVGIACCPADAVNEIREKVQYISPLNGGFGCVRDVIEKVLKLNDHWNYRIDVTSR